MVWRFARLLDGTGRRFADVPCKTQRGVGSEPQRSKVGETSSSPSSSLRLLLCGEDEDEDVSGIPSSTSFSAGCYSAVKKEDEDGDEEARGFEER
jgi:hypothetical protein